MTPSESTNPMDYMSPLWGILIILLVLVAILYLIAKPLHQYITNKKTEELIKREKLEGTSENTKNADGVSGQTSPEEQKKKEETGES